MVFGDNKYYFTVLYECVRLSLSYDTYDASITVTHLNQEVFRHILFKPRRVSLIRLD